MNPIEACVLPLKTDAMASAVEAAVDQIARVLAALEAAGWDLNVAAPRGNSLRDRKEDYMRKNAKRNFFASVTKRVETHNYRIDAPSIVEKCVESECRYMAAVAENAAEQYDLFVAKLCKKVGPVVDASLTGSHVWGYSLLTVEKADGTAETWQTQQIINQSIYGLLFNQWPTRKLKPARTRKAA
jgi:hypothetical protein